MIEKLRDELMHWYANNARELPWRYTNDPYKVWLSEIILQQTRVNQGMPYYLKFVDHYPTVKHLAEADEQKVLNDWQGLGYYSRARNLQTAAKQVMEVYNGEFPNTYDELIKLKGIGAYTAAAIASIAFNEPKAVLDGNVFRVLSRLFGIEDDISAAASRKVFQQMADKLLSIEAPGTFNQAIMDFGALQCTPKSPACIVCPLNTWCKALKTGKVKELPIKLKKIKRRSRYFHFFRSADRKYVLLKERGPKDIWQGLNQLPLIENNGSKLSEMELEQLMNGKLRPTLEYSKVHKLTHQDIHAYFYTVDSSLQVDGYKKVAVNDLDKYPIPRLIDLYFESIEIG